MADRHVTHLIVGGGPAGSKAAITLAKEADADDTILLVNREFEPPYERVPLSKEYLAGTSTREDAAYDLSDRVEVMAKSSVTALDTDARVATLQSDETISYDNALIASGALINRVKFDGGPLNGVHYVRTYGTSDRIREETDDPREVVLVGGSFIGCEVAATLTGRGARCTILMMEDEPLANAFGETAGRYFRSVLEGHGVTVEGGVEVASFGPSAEDEERIGSVTLKDGRTFPADVVVLGLGARPDTMLASKSGLEIGESGGIACDEQLRTSADHVWAAGDVCEYASVIHGRRVRVEHHDHAERQGVAAARNMLGAGADYAVVPYFFSDLADWASLEYVGPAREWASEEVEGDPSTGSFMVRYLDADGALLAALSVGGGGDLGAARTEIKQRA